MFRFSRLSASSASITFPVFPIAFVLTVAGAILLQVLHFTTPGKGRGIFLYLTLSQDLIAVWLQVGVLLLAWLLVNYDRQLSEQYFGESLALRVHRSFPLIAMASFLVFALIARLCFHAEPLSMDEYCVLFQAQTFAAGKLAAQVNPELLDFLVLRPFQGNFLAVSHAQGTIASSYWPGYSLLLAPFAFFQVPWLCNPTLTVLTLVLIHRLALRLTQSAECAGWAVLFTLCSSAVVINAGTYYSMPAHLLCNTLWCYLLTLHSKKASWWAGVVGGFALVLHNPLPHLLFALPWFVLFVRRHRDVIWPALLGYLVFALPLGIGWRLFLCGFEPAPYVGKLTALINWPSGNVWLARLVGFDKTMIWAVTGLMVLALVGWSATRNVSLRLLGASLLCTFTGYLFVVFDQGHGWGFRYLHSAWMALPLLAAVAMLHVVKRDKAWPQATPLVPLFGLAALLGLGVIVPFQAIRVGKFVAYHINQVPLPPQEPALVFIREGGTFRPDLVQNDPFLRDSTWRLCFQSEAANARLARRWLLFPRRVQSGVWGETWVGQGFLRSPSP